MNGHEQLEVNGIQPPILGAVCEELIAVQLWSAGVLAEPVNVAYLKFDGAWYRLYFDHGIIFWRDGDSPPTAFSAPEIKADYKLDDLGDRHGLRGCGLISIACSPTANGSKVALVFSADRAITFECYDDRTDYTC